MFVLCLLRSYQKRTRGILRIELVETLMRMCLTIFLLLLVYARPRHSPCAGKGPEELAGVANSLFASPRA